MGYATINGDMSGGFAPIADVPKTKLFALARWLNERAKCKVQSEKDAKMQRGKGAKEDKTESENYAPKNYASLHPGIFASNVIPEAIILKPPGAELAINPETGKLLKAEEALMPYEFMDEVIWRIENKHEGFHDMINSTFLYETKHKVTVEEKKAWLEKFYNRMSKALYKWSILPPSVIVEGRSINKNDYRQPITSVKINYKGHSREEIAGKLQKI